MSYTETEWKNPIHYLTTRKPEEPVHFFCPEALQAQAKRFLDGFPGLVTYAVKSNPSEQVLTNLVAAGVTGFDVASPAEIRTMRRLAPNAALHYNNPVRTRSELRVAVENGVCSYSVDRMSELEKLAEVVPTKGIEVAVRFKLPVSGAYYDFGAKFGAHPNDAVKLLQKVVELGYIPSLNFHPGTQCEEPAAYRIYIMEASEIARKAEINVKRLNVGGGFPSMRHDDIEDLEYFFRTIKRANRDAFGDNQPDLICEPGRGMVGDSFALAAQVKGLRDDGAVYLNDGIYGGLSEFKMVNAVERFVVLSPEGVIRTEETESRVVFGPTCDSSDSLMNKLDLPADIADEDYILFQSMGAYVIGVTTDFNGFGQLQSVMVTSLS
ncbi:MAG: type III PLP-dependent enzyme [Rhodobacter sp.]|jgi:ornithine decarboxylase|nr:type III PLP-dependent enzyme [Rhodobacter sp.]